MVEELICGILVCAGEYIGRGFIHGLEALGQLAAGLPPISFEKDESKTESENGST